MKANMFRTMGAAAVLLGGMGGASLAQASLSTVRWEVRELETMSIGSHARRGNRHR